VEAPDGTLAVAVTPLDKLAVTDRVGFPRESRISNALKPTISDIAFPPSEFNYLSGIGDETKSSTGNPCPGVIIRPAVRRDSS
jgi:hypothetical protein